MTKWIVKNKVQNNNNKRAIKFGDKEWKNLWNAISKWKKLRKFEIAIGYKK